MLLQFGDRKQIADVLTGRIRSDRREVTDHGLRELARLPPQGFAAFWSRDHEGGDPLPDVLVTTDAEERDWIAWLTTFAPTIRPFTAYCRIVGASSFSARLAAEREPELGRLEGACVGLVLGELLSSEESLVRSPDALPTSLCLSTLSFALFREIALYGHNDARSTIPEKWAHLRALTRQRGRPLDAATVVEVATKLVPRGREGCGAHDPIADAMKDLVTHGELSPSTDVQVLSPLLPTRSWTKLAREDRLRAFEEIAATSMATPLPVPNGGFAIGYLASRLNPGTLSHAPLVAPLLARYPSAMLYYATCAGLTEPSSLLASLGAAGRRVLREVLRREKVVERPHCDIAIGELEALMTGGGELPPFATATIGVLLVELEPGVSSIVSATPIVRARHQFEPERVEESLSASEELTRVLHRLSGLQRRLQAEEATRERRSEGRKEESRSERRGRGRSQ